MRRVLACFLVCASATTAAAQTANPSPSPTCAFKAGSVVIYSGGQGRAIGRFEGRMGDDGSIQPQPARPVVHIWRSFTPDDDEMVKKHRLAAGKAYQELSGERLRFICNVALSLNDKQMAALFSVRAD